MISYAYSSASQTFVLVLSYYSYTFSLAADSQKYIW